jgi:hypothetical protein
MGIWHGILKDISPRRMDRLKGISHGCKIPHGV